MSENFFTINKVNGTGSLLCMPSTFEDTDPLPGEEKGCYCDEKNIEYSDDDSWEIKEYWRYVRLE